MGFHIPRVLLTQAARKARKARVESDLRLLPPLACYNQESLAVIEGCMLSDAGLTCKTNGSHGLFSMSLSGEEHLDWLNSVNGNLTALGLEHKLHYPTVRPVKNTKGDYINCRLWTRVDPFFTMMYKRWYPNGRKEVPGDFVLTPILLANWFMGDGCSSWCFGGLVSVYFSTQAFSNNSTELLKAGLSQLGVKQVNNHRPSRGSAPGAELTTTSAANVSRLMEIIEPLILPSYKYKIKYPRRLKR